MKLASISEMQPIFSKDRSFYFRNAHFSLHFIVCEKFVTLWNHKERGAVSELDCTPFFVVFFLLSYQGYLPAAAPFISPSTTACFFTAPLARLITEPVSQ